MTRHVGEFSNDAFRNMFWVLRSQNLKKQAWKAFQPERARQVLISPACFLKNCYFDWDLVFKQLKSGIINGNIEIDLMTVNS